MHAIDKHLTLLNPYKRFLDTAFSHTKGFYLRTMQRDARLPGILDKIIMIRFFIVCYQFNTILRHIPLCS